MSGNRRRKENQYWPFVTTADRAQPFIAYRGDPGNDAPWSILAEGIKRHPGKDSLTLRFLVAEYRKAAKTLGTDAALKDSWEKLSGWSPAIFTDDMRQVLVKARQGDLDAAQTIVRACPEAVHLPFIADCMSAVVQRFKYSKIGKRTDGKDHYAKGEEARHSLEDLRAAWDGFLPKRAGGDVPYAAEDLKRVFKKARQQGAAADEIGEAFGVSAQTVKKKIKIHKSRGRPTEKKSNNR